MNSTNPTLHPHFCKNVTCGTVQTEKLCDNIEIVKGFCFVIRVTDVILVAVLEQL